MRIVDHAKINIYYLQKNEEEFLDDISNRIKNTCKDCLCFLEEDKDRLKETLVDFAKRFRYLSLIQGNKIDENSGLRFTCPTQSDDHFIRYINKMNQKLENIAFDVFNHSTFDWNDSFDVLKQNGLHPHLIETTLRNIFEKPILENSKKQKIFEKDNIITSLLKNANLRIWESGGNNLLRINYNSALLIDSKCIFGTNNCKIVTLDHQKNEFDIMPYHNPDLNSQNAAVKLFDNALTNKIGYFWQHDVVIQDYLEDQPINSCLGNKNAFTLADQITAACFLPSEEGVTSFLAAEKNIKIYKLHESGFFSADVRLKGINRIQIQTMKYFEDKVYIGLFKKFVALDLERNETDYSRIFGSGIVKKITLDNNYIITSNANETVLFDRKDLQIVHEFKFGSIDAHIDQQNLFVAESNKIFTYDLRKFEEPVKSLWIDDDDLTQMKVTHDSILYTGKTGKIYKLESAEDGAIEN